MSKSEISSEFGNKIEGPGLWVDENHEDILQMRYRVKKTLFSGKSDFQQIDIVETHGFGKMLFNDGLAMVSERDEFVYHDMIAHVPLFVHPNPKRVLVIGGGDGGTVREVLRHKSVEFCQLVEIDPLVVNGCKEHMPQLSSELSDSRANVLIADGVKYVKETKDKFDVVIVDSTDPIGPATPLFNVDFYNDVMSLLNEEGVVVSQCESPFYYLEAQKAFLGILNQVFNRVHLYNYTNLTYPGGLWSFSLCTKEACPLADFDEERVRESGLEFSWYSSDIHRASFALPAFQKSALVELLTPFK